MEPSGTVVEDEAVTGVADRELLADRVADFSATDVMDRPQHT